MTTDAITSFHGPHRFLSNFYPAPVMLDGKDYPSVEHAFQAAKTTDPAMRWHFQREPTAGGAKRLGRRVTLRDDWEQIKLQVMMDLVWLKFQEPSLAARLVETAGRDLIESNHWNDRFWGVCGGVGDNWLGRILMTVRDTIIERRTTT